jgi:hypothetical protein
MDTWRTITVVVVALLGVLGVLQFFYLRAAARRQFDGLCLTAEDPRFAVDGANAVVVLERRQYIEGADAPNRYSLFRICKNPHGEYFLFMSGKKPYVTHLTKERAMNALRFDKKAFAKEFSDANAA